MKGRLARLLAPVAVLVCLYGLSQTEVFYHLFNQIDERLYKGWTHDAYKSTLPHDMLKTHRSVGVFLIDESSLDELQLEWPLPRALYPAIAANLRAAGAKTLALDVLFPNPGPDPAQDRALANLLQSEDVIVAGKLKADGDSLVLEPPHSALVTGWGEVDYRRRLGTVVAGPLKRSLNPDSQRGDAFEEFRFATLRIDHQPTNVLGQVTGEPQRYYSLDVLALAHFLDQDPEAVLRGSNTVTTPISFLGLPTEFTIGRIAYLPAGIEREQQRDAPIPTDLKEGEVRYVPAQVQRQETIADYIQVFGLKQVLVAPSEIQEAFGGRPFLALVGVAVEGQDTKTSPLGQLFGVEIHANILANLIEDGFLHPITRQQQLLLLLLACGLMAAATNLTEPRVSAVVGLLMLGGLYALGRYAFIERLLVLPMTTPALGIVCTYLVGLLLRYLQVKSRLQDVTLLFKEVCPIHDLEKLEQEGGLTLGGEERILTIFFSDLRGYTSFAEKLDAVTVLDTLNEYFGAVGHIFDEYGGCVCDYQGDAQMVVFGLLPASAENSAVAACRAAAAMSRRLDQLRAQWEKQGRVLPETGVGICSGPVSFGVLGTAQHKQYTAIGDATNTAARVQGKSSELGYRVLLTESARQMAGDAIEADFVDALELKGKQKKIPVYGLVIDRNRPTPGRPRNIAYEETVGSLDDLRVGLGGHRRR